MDGVVVEEAASVRRREVLHDRAEAREDRVERGDEPSTGKFEANIARAGRRDRSSRTTSRFDSRSRAGPAGRARRSSAPRWLPAARAGTPFRQPSRPSADRSGGRPVWFRAIRVSGNSGPGGAPRGGATRGSGGRRRERRRESSVPAPPGRVAHRAGRPRARRGRARTRPAACDGCRGRVGAPVRRQDLGARRRRRAGPGRPHARETFRRRRPATQSPRRAGHRIPLGFDEDGAGDPEPCGVRTVVGGQVVRDSARVVTVAEGDRPRPGARR